MNFTANVTKGRVLRYMLLPQIAPRLNDFYRQGFGHLAYLIALVYRAVNILPASHWILRRENRAHLTLRNVLAAAAGELQFSKGHIDKIIIYFAILIGLVLLAGQFVLMLGFLMANPAMAADAAPKNYGDFFAEPTSAKTDVARNLLLAVFGMSDIFGYNGEIGVGYQVSNGLYQRGFHALLQFYSTGLLVIAVLIVCYYIFAVVAETAETGVPFGKRYNKVWAPIRFVVALGLLIPIGSGLNSAQYVVLYSAKFGSDFATKGWTTFNEKMNSEYLKDPKQRMATPRPPDLMPLASFMMVVDACKMAYEEVYKNQNVRIKSYIVKSSADANMWQLLSEGNFKAARSFANDGDIQIRFGAYDQTVYRQEKGNVAPYCGDLILPAASSAEPGAVQMQEYYYDLVAKMFNGSYDIKKYGENYFKKYADLPTDATADTNLKTYKSSLADQLRKDTVEAIDKAVADQASAPIWANDMQKIKDLGWAGAGVWYNKIAQVNGSLVTATLNIPQVRAMPQALMYIRSQQLAQNVNQPQLFSTNLATGEMKFQKTLDRNIGGVLKRVQDAWDSEDADQSTTGANARRTGNIFIDVVNLIFGTQGLFDMCKNADVHPLAQLSALGKGMIESSIRNIGLSMITGGVAAIQIPFLGAAAGAASSILMSVATVTITAGFILFYVLPFMPFLYFFFAVGGWIKGIFEAMVGVPLWALAHLRIDGEGLPGDAAMDGYYLILEIFLRPILILFGLLASIIIFAAMVKVLNQIFALVVTNLSGHGDTDAKLCGAFGTTGGGTGGGGNLTVASFMRGPIDQLFFTIIYAIIVYIIGLSCFKLIDLIPNNILRYMGVRAATFNDQAGDPTTGLLTRLSAGGGILSNQVLGSGGVAGGAMGAVTNFAGAGAGLVRGSGGGGPQ